MPKYEDNPPTAPVVQSDRDPSAEKPGAHVPTFFEASLTVQEQLCSHRSSPRQVKDWQRPLELHVLPHIGSLRVSNIEPRDILNVLEPIWLTKPATARKLRSQIIRVMSWAIAMGFRTDNPAGEAMAGALPVVRIPKNVPVVIPHEEVAEVLSAVRASEARAATKLALEFLVLTAARSGEVRGARWEDMDLDGAFWTVPDWMHRWTASGVPLSSQALSLLNEARELGGGDGFVFPNRSNRPISSSSLSALLRALRNKAIPHSFRASFRQWCADTGVPPIDAGLCLGHVIPSDDRRTNFRPHRPQTVRKVMEDWGVYVCGERFPS